MAVTLPSKNIESTNLKVTFHVESQTSNISIAPLPVFDIVNISSTPTFLYRQ